jgi:DNA-binding NtrC family response regulator
LVAQGLLRSDLEALLVPGLISVPPLRERWQDVAPLATHLLARIASHDRRAVARLGEGAIEALHGLRLEGNALELGAILQRALVGAEDGVLEAEHLLAALPPPVRWREGTLRDWRAREELKLDQRELEHIDDTYKRCGTWGETAKVLDYDEKSLIRHRGRLAKRVLTQGKT